MLRPNWRNPYAMDARSAAPRGTGSLRTAMIVNRIADASASLRVAPHNGGTVSFPIAITRNVLPQISTQPRNAAVSRRFGGEVKGGIGDASYRRRLGRHKGLPFGARRSDGRETTPQLQVDAERCGASAYSKRS